MYMRRYIEIYTRAAQSSDVLIVSATVIALWSWLNCRMEINLGQSRSLKLLRQTIV